MEMRVHRGDWLGFSLLLWSGAALLALYLLGNPAAAALQETLDPIRLWGGVLGLTFLGAALPSRNVLPWLLLLGTFPLLLLPAPLNRRWGAFALAGTAFLGVLGLAGRRLHGRAYPNARPVWRKRGTGHRPRGLARPKRRPAAGPTRSAPSPKEVQDGD
ncbi:MAG: hypothetical protein ACP5OO_08115 [Chloroflexia bacterium]